MCGSRAEAKPVRWAMSTKCRGASGWGISESKSHLHVALPDQVGHDGEGRVEGRRHGEQRHHGGTDGLLRCRSLVPPSGGTAGGHDTVTLTIPIVARP